jgi:hypothetical protein
VPAKPLSLLERDALLAASDEVLLKRCEIDRYRASGPGGQHRNKTDSAVRLRLPALGLSAIAEESRSQHDNKSLAIRRMRAEIAVAVRVEIDDDMLCPSPRLAVLLAAGTKPLGEKTRSKPEFWLAIADLLDVLWSQSSEVAATAQRVGCTTGALSKMLLHDEIVARAVNEMRRHFERKPLR